jgi:transposase-like protein
MRETTTLADEMTMALETLLRKAQLLEHDADFLRDGLRALSEALIEPEVARYVGAERHERTPERIGQRNGYGEREWDMRVGTIELRVPRVRDGGYSPSLLDPRRRAERALVEVVQEAYVQGASTRWVDAPVQALGMTEISKRQLSRLCQTLDEEVEQFRARPLVGPYPYIWLDGAYLKVRQGGRVRSMAVVLAIGVRATGVRKVLGLDLGPSEDGAFWLACLRSLVARGLGGVRRVISDAHQGLEAAITAVLQGAGWQRCRVHVIRNALALVPKASAAMVAATIRNVFVQVEADAAREQWRPIADTFRPRYERLAELLDDAEADVLARLAFPREDWRKIWSNNPLEPLSKGFKRRTDSVSIFPILAAIIRLVGAVLNEQHDEWQVARRYFSAKSLAKLRKEAPADPPPALLAAG